VRSHPRNTGSSIVSHRGPPLAVQAFAAARIVAWRPADQEVGETRVRIEAGQTRNGSATEMESGLRRNKLAPRAVVDNIFDYRRLDAGNATMR